MSDLPERFDAIYLSPHPDDVAFSAAAQLRADVDMGRQVAVYTLFQSEGSRLREFSDDSGRRGEDQTYAALSGCTVRHGPWLDATSRDPLNALPTRVFAPIHQGHELVEQVREQLQKFVDRGCRRVVAPLGVGEHVDHQITYAAARSLTGCQVSFYEDAPYVYWPFALARRLARLGYYVDPSDPSDSTLLRGSRLEEARAIEEALRATPLVRGASFQVRLLAVTSMAVEEFVDFPPIGKAAERLTASVMGGDGVSETKLAAVAAYASQWPLFYATIEQWRSVMQKYAAAVGHASTIERSWTLPL